MIKDLKKYRLGNRPEEYELREDFLGWAPENEDWATLCMQCCEDKEVTLVNPNNGDKKILFWHCFIIKEAFPLSFFGEDRSRNWCSFAIVSEGAIGEKFIIPLH